MSSTFITPGAVASQVSSSGIWKTYGVDSSFANPFTNVTIGNGVLAARWWQQSDPPVDYSTAPFLVFIYVALKFGTTTSVDGNILFSGPVGLGPGAAFELDPYLATSNGGSPDDFALAWPTQAQAFINGTPSGRHYPGFGITGPDATSFVTNNVDPISGSLWGVGVPDTWTTGSYLSVQRTYLGAFYGS